MIDRYGASEQGLRDSYVYMIEENGVGKEGVMRVESHRGPPRRKQPPESTQKPKRSCSENKQSAPGTLYLFDR
jgi:hypothetical protein